MSLEFHKINKEITALSNYLDFIYEYLLKSSLAKQDKTNELLESIEKLRQSEGIPNEVSDNDIILQATVIGCYYSMSHEEENKEEHEKNPWINVSTIESMIAYEREISDEYENMFYATIVIMLYSCIERGLVGLCNLQEKNDKGIVPQARDFLDNKLGYRIDNAVWKELKFIRWVRNTIVHSGMSFPLDYSLGEIVYDSIGNDVLVKAQPESIEYLKLKNIYIKETGEISLNLDYCKYLIEFARSFFLKIQVLDTKSKGKSKGNSENQQNGGSQQIPDWVAMMNKNTQE